MLYPDILKDVIVPGGLVVGLDAESLTIVRLTA